MYGYVYKTTNLLNGRIYIGQKKGNFTPKYLGSGLILKRAIKAHSINNFKVESICYLPTKEQIDLFEKHMIAKYREILGMDMLYNIVDGGTGTSGEFMSHIARKTWTGRKHKAESKIKIGLSNSLHKGVNHAHYGKKKTIDHCKNISIATKGISKGRKTIGFTGRKHSDDTKNKMSLAHMGNKSNLGKKASEETRTKMRMAHFKRGHHGSGN